MKPIDSETFTDLFYLIRRVVEDDTYGQEQKKREVELRLGFDSIPTTEAFNEFLSWWGGELK